MLKQDNKANLPTQQANKQTSKEEGSKIKMNEQLIHTTRFTGNRNNWRQLSKKFLVVAEK